MARHMRQPLAVCVGGGTGQPQVLRALRGRDWDLAAVVAMADDGGSTGAIRRAMGAVPPGDIRNCLVALADDPDSPLARSLQRRLPVAGNHALGNLLLATLAEECGSFVDAVRSLERALHCTGHVHPSTAEYVTLHGITRDGRRISGEEMIGNGPCTLKRVWLMPERPTACDDAVRAIRSADLVVLGPGSLFTSIIPNVLVPGIADALRETEATRVFICPKADTQYESWGLAADEYVGALYDHGLEGCVDAVLVHRSEPQGGTGTRAFRALTAEDVAADAARRAFIASRRFPYSENVLPRVHPVRADNDVLSRLRDLVPIVEVRDFSLEGAPTAHDPSKLASAIEGVAGCRSLPR